MTPPPLKTLTTPASIPHTHESHPNDPNTAGTPTPAGTPATNTHTPNKNVATTLIDASTLHDLNAAAAVATQSARAAICCLKHVGSLMRGKITARRIGTANSRTAALTRSGRPYMPRTKFPNTGKRRRK